MTKDKFPNFYKWTFSKWYFWVIVFIWGVLSGLEELRQYYIPEFLATLSISFVLVLLLFLISYSIKKFIYKRVKEEIKSELKKN